MPVIRPASRKATVLASAALVALALNAAACDDAATAKPAKAPVTVQSISQKDKETGAKAH